MNKSKSSLFLMELIISILFFSICAVVCVQLFVQSHLTNQEATNKAQANLCIQNLAEVYLGCNGDTDRMCELFNLSSQDKNTPMAVFYDSEWNISSSDNYSYTAQIALSEQDNMCSANITISDSNDAIIAEQLIKHYRQIHTEVKP